MWSLSKTTMLKMSYIYGLTSEIIRKFRRFLRTFRIMEILVMLISVITINHICPNTCSKYKYMQVRIIVFQPQTCTQVQTLRENKFLVILLQYGILFWCT